MKLGHAVRCVSFSPTYSTLQMFILLLFWQGSTEYMNIGLGKIIMLAFVCPRVGLVFEHVTARC